MAYETRVILDSVSPDGMRLTTMIWRYWLPIHPEVMTYRSIARNAASNRAMPVRKTIASVLKNPAGPVYWAKNGKGMSPSEELTGWRKSVAQSIYYALRYPAVAGSYALSKLPTHKQVANRLLIPWQWIEIIVTLTPEAAENIWRQRVHPAAQQEFQHLATLAQSAYNNSTPTTRAHHLPFVYSDETDIESIFDAYMISVARCARVSYLTHLGVRSLSEDIRLYSDLSTANPPHMSPFEHACAAGDPRHRSGPFVGWIQLREAIDPYWFECVDAYDEYVLDVRSLRREPFALIQHTLPDRSSSGLT